MKSKISLFNKGIVLCSLRRFSLLSILYTYVLLYIVPLQLIWSSGSGAANPFQSSEIFFLTTLLSLIIPVILSMCIFRYIQTSTASDLFHSLPIKRKILYRSNILSGFILLTLPVLITAVISVILLLVRASGSPYGIWDITRWMLFTVSADLAVFLLCTFTGMLVRRTSLQGVLTYALMILPVLMVMLTLINFRALIHGILVNPDYSGIQISDSIIFSDGIHFSLSNPNVWRSWPYLLLACIPLYYLGQHLYIRRNEGSVSAGFINRYLDFIFKYSIAYSLMLLAGILFFHERFQNLNLVFVYYFIGSFVGYFAAEILTSKSFRFLKVIPGFALYSTVMLLLLLAIKVDIFGIRGYIPDTSKVQNVCFSQSIADSASRDSGPSIPHGTAAALDIKQAILSNTKDLEALSALHKRLAEDESENKFGLKGRFRVFTFVYSFKDGQSLRRDYYIPYNDDYNKLLKPIFQSEDFIKANYPLLNIGTADISGIEIRPDGTTDRKARITNPEEIKEAASALCKDLRNSIGGVPAETSSLSETARFIIPADKKDKYPLLNCYDNPQIIIQGLKSYSNFEDWLQRKGYLSGSKILSEDINYAIVAKSENMQDVYKSVINMSIDPSKLTGVKIVNKDQIAACFEKSYDPVKDHSYDYITAFVNDKGKVIYSGVLIDHNIPDFVKDYFAKQ